MGWTDLFKSKSAKLDPDPRVRWFGKLPTYADYYSSPAEEDWAVEFNDWVLKGFQIYQSQLADAGLHRHKLPSSGCVIRLPNSEMTVFASIQDFGGDMRGRPFPLCFYAGVPTAQWPGPTSDLWSAGAQVVRDLAALHRQVPHFLNSPGRFESVFGGREVDLSEIDSANGDGSWVSRARGIPLADWFAGAEPVIKVKDPQAWFPLVARWGDNIRTLESEEFEPTLRLPLSAGLPADVQAAGWLCWLELRMNLRRRMLSLVISGDLEHEPGHLSVVARELIPGDFLLGTVLSSALLYVDDLSEAKSGDESKDAPSSADGYGGPAGTWIEFAESRPATP